MERFIFQVNIRKSWIPFCKGMTFFTSIHLLIIIPSFCHSCIFFCHSCESRNPFFYWYSWIPHQVRNHKESGNCHSQLDWESTLLPPCHSRNLLSGIHSSPLCHSRNFYRESIPFKEV